MLTKSGSIGVKSVEKAKQSKVSQLMNRINVGQENEKEERASVSSLAYFLNSGRQSEMCKPLTKCWQPNT